MPQIWGVKLVGRLPDWVSAKDVILEMLRRHGVKGGVDRIIEYYGPGLDGLSAMDRHVIANMGAELGATTTVFPSDQKVRRFLQSQDAEQDWIELVADAEARLRRCTRKSTCRGSSRLIAMPSSPGNVVPVREVAGSPIYQAYIGSSANPGYRDFAIAAEIVEGSADRSAGLVRRQSHFAADSGKPGARRPFADVDSRRRADSSGRLQRLHRHGPGARDRQAQPAHRAAQFSRPLGHARRSGVPGQSRNRRRFRANRRDHRPAHSGNSLSTKSPSPTRPLLNPKCSIPPPGADESREESNWSAARTSFRCRSSMPIPDELEVVVLLKVGDNISTDEILPAGARVLPFRSNIPAISEFAFNAIDPDYPKNAREAADERRPRHRRRAQLWAGLEPRTCGARAAISRIAGGDRQKFRPDSLAESGEFRRLASRAGRRVAIRTDRAGKRVANCRRA